MKMRGIVVLSFLSLVSFGESGMVKRQVFGDIDPKQIPIMLNNDAFVQSQHKCLIATEEEAKTRCDRVGKKLRENMIPSIRKGDCATPCSEQEKEMMVLIISTVQKKYPQVWTDVVKHYNVNQEQLDKLDKWIAEVQSKKN